MTRYYLTATLNSLIIQELVAERLLSSTMSSIDDTVKLSRSHTQRQHEYLIEQTKHNEVVQVARNLRIGVRQKHCG